MNTFNFEAIKGYKVVVFDYFRVKINKTTNEKFSEDVHTITISAA
ncbi:hypothetical protein [Flavobacterium sp. U410]|jgi:hypothetical protein